MKELLLAFVNYKGCVRYEELYHILRITSKDQMEPFENALGELIKAGSISLIMGEDKQAFVIKGRINGSPTSSK